MAVKVITTSLVVNFNKSSDSSDILKLEIDDREDGLNNGKTSFAPGDTVYLLLFKSPNVTIDNILCTTGSIANVGSAVKSIDDFINFPNEQETNADYPVSGGFTYSLLGGNYNAPLTVINDGTAFKWAAPVSPAAPKIAIFRVRYNSNAIVLRLSGTMISGLDEYPIMVYVNGHTGIAP